MNTSKLHKFAWTFFALALITTTVFGQNNRNNITENNKQNATCLEQISDLTETQKTQILNLESSHQEKMAEFRNQRRSTVNAIEKSEIRTEMLKNVEAHRNEVKSLLTDNQQKEYDLLHYRGNNYRNQNYGFQQGRGRGQGQFSRGNCGNYQGNRNGFNRGNNRRNVQGCPFNNQPRGGNYRNARGYGNGYNSSGS
jgi:hypothetical protein